MIVRLLWIERNLHGEELARREETLHRESNKNPTRNYVGKLIARYHPQLKSVDKVHLIDCEEPGYRWYVRSMQLNSNCWVTAYAQPLDEPTLPPRSQLEETEDDDAEDFKF